VREESNSAERVVPLRRDRVRVVGNQLNKCGDGQGLPAVLSAIASATAEASERMPVRKRVSTG